MSERLHRATAASLARTFHPNSDLPASSGVAQHDEGTGAPSAKQQAGYAFWRRLRGFAAWIATSRERWAVIDELTNMSDRELADIGLSRGQIACVLDPEFVTARNSPHRAAGNREDLGGR